MWLCGIYPVHLGYCLGNVGHRKKNGNFARRIVCFKFGNGQQKTQVSEATIWPAVIRLATQKRQNKQSQAASWSCHSSNLCRWPVPACADPWHTWDAHDILCKGWRKGMIRLKTIKWHHISSGKPPWSSMTTNPSLRIGSKHTKTPCSHSLIFEVFIGFTSTSSSSTKHVPRNLW